MARRVRPIRLLAGLAASALALGLAVACATSAQPRTSSEGPPAAPRLDAAPLAATAVESPASDRSTLTTAFREALVRTSGVDVIDQLQVERALLSCAAPPCDADIAASYASARVVVSASLAQADERSFLGTARALAGSRVLQRATASGSDPLEVVRRLGWELGAALHNDLATAVEEAP